ncbi:sulfotransferase [soil metagenome]
MASDLQVIFVIGNQRSGSTLLANLLGELEGFFAAGELFNLWDRSLQRATARCGCGALLHDCSCWRAILGPITADLDLAEARAAQRAAVRPGNLWARPPGRSTHLELMGRLYRSIAAETGDRLVVDSSKSPAYAATLNRLPGIAALHIHLVRDPRGIVYSRQRGWQTREGERPADDPIEPLPWPTVARVVGSWVRTNLAAEVVVRRWPRSSLRVRYEDLMARPADTLALIAAAAGASIGAWPFESPDIARVSTQHVAAGNPSRFRTGPLHLREDRAWCDGLPRHQQRLVATLAAPLLRRYRYPLRAQPTRR